MDVTAPSPPTGARLRVEVLGPIRAFDRSDRDITPEGGLQRRLLAFLVLRRGRSVSADALIDVLWPDRPPGDPLAALQTHLSRLRRRLPSDIIESTGHGYRLASSQIDLDLDRLTEAVNGAQPDPEKLATIDAVLQRWDGPAYPELSDVDDGRGEALRLAELRVRAREMRAESRLVAGSTDGLVAELASLADEEPLRERPRTLLMSVLASTGRSVEALRVFDDFRRLLGDELGVEPSPTLVAQHAQLLGVDETRWTPTSRLPVAVTSLVGRDGLLREVAALAEAHRVVTLLGPGGVGKTRLMVEMGARLRADHPDRPVVWCELAAASDGSAIDVVAAALTIDGRPGIEMADRVAAVLADTEVVLLLDNCEHVLDPVAELMEHVLATCPHVRVVTTSRERLRVPGEQLVVVPPLPSSTDDAPAVQLFVERAAAVMSGFTPNAEERATITEIVHRLDGLPLAIELAAARLHTLDVNEVASGLDRRFELLSAGSRTTPRHGSLAAAVSWSFGLLDERLRQVFADLSVFASSFTAADAAAVCGLQPVSAAAALDELVERSLVMRGVGRRYVLLETLREFGTERLAADGRLEEAGRRHARHQLDWIEAADQRLVRSAETIAEIDAALPELRLALGWLLDHDQVEPAGRLVVALVDYAILRLRPDVMGWAGRVTDADPHDGSPVAALVWTASAYAAWMAGDVAETGMRSARAIEASQRDGGVPAEVASICGNYELFEGRLHQAVSWYRRAVDSTGDDLAQQILVMSTEVLALAYAGDPAANDAASALLAAIGEERTPYAAYAWFCAGEADLSHDVERARTRFERALELAEVTHASFVTGVAGTSKASIEARMGDPVLAAADYRRLIAHWRRAGMWSTQWTMLRSIAGLLARLDRPREAALLAGAVLATDAGHRIYGDDQTALNELTAGLRRTLGDGPYAMALVEGGGLDGDAAVDLALRAL